MEEKKIMIRDILSSKTADENTKGDRIFYEINKFKDDTTEIILDFQGIELVNTAFLNNAIGPLFDLSKFDINVCKVKVMNMQESMMELLKETIKVARMKYV